MNKFRIRIASQDAIIGGIIAAMKAEHNAEVREAIRVEGAKLAAKWGVKHPDLPDTRRDAAS